MKYKDWRFLIKNNFLAIFRKPATIIYLPLFIISYIWKRISYQYVKVYYVETDCKTFLETNTNLRDSIINEGGFKYSEIHDYVTFKGLFNLRISDDEFLNPYYQKEIDKRFKSDYIAGILKINKEICGYIFLKAGVSYIDQIDVLLELDKDQFTFTDLFIFNSFRGKKLHELLYYFVVKEMSEKGYLKFYCWLMKHNQRSIKSHVKIGIENVIKEISRTSILFTSKNSTKDVNYSLKTLIRND